MIVVVTRNTVRRVIIYHDPPQVVCWEEKRDDLALSVQTKLHRPTAGDETGVCIRATKRGKLLRPLPVCTLSAK